MPGGSAYPSFFSIVHEIQSSFDYKPPTEVVAIFLQSVTEYLGRKAGKF